MTDARPIETTNLDRYGHGPLDWSRARSLLDATGKAMDTWYLGTTSPDGSPHAAGVGALWHDGELYFTSGAASRKSRNLARPLRRASRSRSRASTSCSRAGRCG
jgi:hypothetical protein